MRIGLLIYGSLNTLSGGYLYDRILVEHLRSKGAVVEVISIPWRNYARHLGDNFSSGLVQRLSDLDLDVLLQDELNHPSLFWQNPRLRRRVGCPLVAIVHHLRWTEQWPAWQRAIYRWVETRYLKTVDGFVFNSQTTKQTVQALIGAEVPGVVAVPAGDRFPRVITETEIVERSAAPGPLKIVYVGNVIPRKGLHVVVSAFQKLPPGDFMLLVAGRTDVQPAYFRPVLDQITRSGLDNRISFRGPLKPEDLSQLLQESHVLVVPSSLEGYGIVYVEGMGFGLPAVATTGGAASEIITNGQDGFLINPEDADGLAQILHLLHQDRTRLRQMSRAALERFNRHPGWSQSMARVHYFLVDLIGSSKKLRAKPEGWDV